MATRSLWFKPQQQTGTTATAHPIPGDQSTAGESINDELKDYAIGATDWMYREEAAILHEWAERFNNSFRLDLETPVIAIGNLPVRTLGTYHPKRNAFGLKREIVLNALHVTRPLAEQLATLLHEMLHQWQEQWGKANEKHQNGYHNHQFRFMAQRFGLIVDHRGRHLGIEPGPFTKILAEHGVDSGTLPVAHERPVMAKRPRGNSKLKKWSCGCTNAWVAVEFHATCAKCGRRFIQSLP